jgi:hypothetical protein
MAGYVRWWHDSEALTGPAYVGYRAKTGKHLLVAGFLSLTPRGHAQTDFDPHFAGRKFLI